MNGGKKGKMERGRLEQFKLFFKHAGSLWAIATILITVNQLVHPQPFAILVCETILLFSLATLMGITEVHYICKRMEVKGKMGELEKLKKENERLRRYNIRLEALVKALTEELRLMLESEANVLKFYLKVFEFKLKGGETANEEDSS